MALKCNLSPDEIESIKQSFSAYREIKERKKELADEEKAIKQDVARVIEGKTKDANLLLKSMAQQWESGENDLDEVGAVMEMVRTNGSYNDEE